MGQRQGGKERKSGELLAHDHALVVIQMAPMQVTRLSFWKTLEDRALP